MSDNGPAGRVRAVGTAGGAVGSAGGPGPEARVAEAGGAVALGTGVPGAGVAHRPDPLGHFGAWGGRFVPEVLMAALDQLTDAFEDAVKDP